MQRKSRGIDSPRLLPSLTQQAAVQELQPGAAALVIGDVARDDGPEIRRVIQLPEMGKLVYDNVIDKLRLGKNQQQCLKDTWRSSIKVLYNGKSAQKCWDYISPRTYSERLKIEE